MSYYIAAQSLQPIGDHYSKIHMLLCNNNFACHKEEKMGGKYYAMHSFLAQEITFNKVMASSTTF